MELPAGDYIGMRRDEIDTPVLLVDLDALDSNIEKMAAHFRETGKHLRPHSKSHKTPAIAQMQIRAGAIGIVSQKIGEAAAMADAGIEDILIPYNIVGAHKLERLSQLVRESDSAITVAADSSTTVEGLSAQASADGCTFRVLVEMDTGGHRCGTQSPQDTLALAQRIDGLPGLDFMGVMTYPSSERVRPILAEVRSLMDGAGLPLHIISGGGTGSEEISKSLGCTETRIGSYAYEGMTRVSKRFESHAASDCAIADHGDNLPGRGQPTRGHRHAHRG